MGRDAGIIPTAALDWASGAVGNEEESNSVRMELGGLRGAGSDPFAKMPAGADRPCCPQPTTTFSARTTSSPNARLLSPKGPISPPADRIGGGGEKRTLPPNDRPPTRSTGNFVRSGTP